MHLEQQQSSQTIFKGRILTVRQDVALLENGKTATRDVIEHPGGVAVLAVEEDNTIYMVRQFRYPLGKALLELPAGKLEYGEDPRICGIRELEEEAGCVADCFTLLGTLYPSPAYTNERLYLYLATGLRQTAQHLDEDEFLTVERLPLAKVKEMILAGEIEDAKTQIAILKYLAINTDKG